MLLSRRWSSDPQKGSIPARCAPKPLTQNKEWKDTPRFTSIWVTPALFVEKCLKQGIPLDTTTHSSIEMKWSHHGPWKSDVSKNCGNKCSGQITGYLISAWYSKEYFRSECCDRVDDQKVGQRKWEVHLSQLWESFLWEEQSKATRRDSSRYVSSLHCLWKELQDKKHSWPPLHPEASKWSSVPLDN